MIHWYGGYEARAARATRGLYLRVLSPDKGGGGGILKERPESLFFHFQSSMLNSPSRTVDH